VHIRKRAPPGGPFVIFQGYSHLAEGFVVEKVDPQAAIIAPAACGVAQIEDIA